MKRPPFKRPFTVNLLTEVEIFVTAHLHFKNIKFCELIVKGMQRKAISKNNYTHLSTRKRFLWSHCEKMRNNPSGTPETGKISKKPIRLLQPAVPAPSLGTNAISSPPYLLPAARLATGSLSHVPPYKYTNITHNHSPKSHQEHTSYATKMAFHHSENRKDNS